MKSHLIFSWLKYWKRKPHDRYEWILFKIYLLYILEISSWNYHICRFCKWELIPFQSNARLINPGWSWFLSYLLGVKRQSSCSSLQSKQNTLYSPVFPPIVIYIDDVARILRSHAMSRTNQHHRGFNYRPVRFLPCKMKPVP